MRTGLAIRFISGLLGLLVLVACNEPIEAGKPAARILAMGDSMMAWNSSRGQSVSHVVETALGEEVLDRSVNGAYVIYNLPISGALGLRISSQYVDGDWDWVILNGGGVDLWLGCGCQACDKRLTKMISKDGKHGEIASTVARIRASGARVIYLGYLRTPGRDSPIDGCRHVGDALEGRLKRMADRDLGVFFLPVRDLVPFGDLSYHAGDRVHPSAKGSAAIGARVAKLIKRQSR